MAKAFQVVSMIQMIEARIGYELAHESVSDNGLDVHNDYCTKGEFKLIH